MTNPKPFYSTDLNLAAAIMTKGHRLEEIDSTLLNRSRFRFLMSPSLEHDIENYYNRILQVPALTYAENIKTLKSRISNG